MPQGGEVLQIGCRHLVGGVGGSGDIGLGGMGRVADEAIGLPLAVVVELEVEEALDTGVEGQGCVLDDVAGLFLYRGLIRSGMARAGEIVPGGHPALVDPDSFPGQAVGSQFLGEELGAIQPVSGVAVPVERQDVEVEAVGRLGVLVRVGLQCGEEGVKPGRVGEVCLAAEEHHRLRVGSPGRQVAHLEQAIILGRRAVPEAGEVRDDAAGEVRLVPHLPGGDAGRL